MMPVDDGGEKFVKQADGLLTRELSQLSFQDRNAINEEIHGVHTLAPEETPELLERSLTELDTFLDEIVTDPPSLKTAYDLSQGRDLNQTTEPNDSYVNGRDFRLRFLRCELFDVKKAALRIIKYLDFVLEICGEYALRRPIQLNDLTKDEMKVIRSGCIQMLPYRDRAGRPILAIVGDFGCNYDMRMKMKVLLYMFYVTGDIESQRKGLVVLTWPSHPSVFSGYSYDYSHNELLGSLFGSTSIRLCAIHACLPDTFLFRKLRPVIAGALPPSIRPRLKFSVETGIDRQYRLRGFGIPTEIIPITDTGNIKTIYLKQWIKLRDLFESPEKPGARDTEDNTGDIVTQVDRSASPEIVEFPGSCDVLYRIGTTTSCHPGNAAFRELIESKMEEAETQDSSSISFSSLADELINEILQIRKGRFLKWDNRGYWTVLKDRDQTNAKVTASIRDYKRWKSAKNNMQTLDSSTHIFEGQQDLKRRKKSSDGNDAQGDAAPVETTTSTDTQFSFCNL